MLAFSNDYYGLIFRATQSVELFCTYLLYASGLCTLHDILVIMESPRIKVEKNFSCT